MSEPRHENGGGAGGDAGFRDQAAKVTGKVKETVTTARDVLEEMAERTKAGATKVTDTYEDLRAQLDTAVDAADSFVRARPYAALGAALVLGLLIGGSLLGGGPRVIYLKPPKV